MPKDYILCRSWCNCVLLLRLLWYANGCWTQLVRDLQSQIVSYTSWDSISTIFLVARGGELHQVLRCRIFLILARWLGFSIFWVLMFLVIDWSVFFNLLVGFLYLLGAAPAEIVSLLFLLWPEVVSCVHILLGHFLLNHPFTVTFFCAAFFYAALILLDHIFLDRIFPGAFFPGCLLRGCNLWAAFVLPSSNIFWTFFDPFIFF